MIPFAVHTTAVFFSGPYNLQKLPLPVGDLNPHLIRGLSAHPIQTPNLHLD